MSAEVWEQVYDRLAELIEEHRTTLIFVNTRRMAERVARHLPTRLGEKLIAAHHGSMAKEHRLDAEQRLQVRRAQGARGNGVSGARHRYRRGRISSASSARRAPSPASCSASAARDMRSTARRRAGCSRCRATISSNAPRSSTAPTAASSIAS